MSNGDFNGAIELGPPAGTPMMTCPWHAHDMEHPPGSPRCRLMDPEDLANSPRALELAPLVGWLAIQAEALMRHNAHIITYLIKRDGVPITDIIPEFPVPPTV